MDPYRYLLWQYLDVSDLNNLARTDRFFGGIWDDHETWTILNLRDFKQTGDLVDYKRAKRLQDWYDALKRDCPDYESSSTRS